MSVYCTCLSLLLVQLCALGSARSAESLGGIDFRSDYTFLPEVDGWLKLHRVPLDWHTARVQCYHEGAVLASPLNADLWSALTTVVMKTNLDSKFFYSGVSATFNDGVYSSVEGVPLEQLYIQWGKSQPNNPDGREQCLVYYKESQKVTVYDKNCTRLLPYICYRPGSIPDKVTECGTVDKGYKLDMHTGHCYKYHAQAHALRWTVAARVCRAEGGYLADIDSQHEADLLVDMFGTKTNSIWSTMALVGFRMWGDKSWWTVHGKRLDEGGYSLWQDGEPNNFEEPEQCGSIILATGTLNDVSCRIPHAFICEKHPDSLLHLDNDGNSIQSNSIHPFIQDTFTGNT